MEVLNQQSVWHQKRRCKRLADHRNLQTGHCTCSRMSAWRLASKGLEQIEACVSVLIEVRICINNKGAVPRVENIGKAQNAWILKPRFLL